MERRTQHAHSDWRFHHLGARYDVRFSAAEPSRLRITLRGELGWLPYSVEDRNARRQALMLLARLRGAGEDLWTPCESGLIKFACVTLMEGEQAARPPLETIALLMLSLSPRLDPLIDLLRPLPPERLTEIAPAISKAA